MMCQVLGVSRQGYYHYRRNTEARLADPEHQEKLEWVKEIAIASHYTYGRRRMKKAMNVLGFPVTRTMTENLMEDAMEGWLYLAVVIDLYARKVVGWSMSSRMTAQLVCDALLMAIWLRRAKAGLIHHSDRGSQYASHDFRKLLKAHGFKGSMSRKGDCWDNAVVESFFGNLKQERVHWRHYQTRYEAQQDILDYISMFYNSYRLHS
jgi:putative transposase